jgi:hypothetical protein
VRHSPVQCGCGGGGGWGRGGRRTQRMEQRRAELEATQLELPELDGVWSRMQEEVASLEANLEKYGVR